MSLTPDDRAFRQSKFQQLAPLAMPRPELGRRHYPPGSKADTIICGRGERRRGLHASYEKSFEDAEILAVELSPDHYTSFIPGSNERGFGKTPDGRTVILQSGWRGCTAACAEMLKADKGLPIDINNLEMSNLGDEERYLEEAGLKILVTKQETNAPLSLLSECLKRHGSGILNVGGHVVVLDKLNVEEGNALIRDPYHGWSVVVTLEALLKRIRRVNLVQVEGEKSRTEVSQQLPGWVKERLPPAGRGFE